MNTKSSKQESYKIVAEIIEGSEEHLSLDQILSMYRKNDGVTVRKATPFR